MEMLNQDLLQELTESYLKSLIAQAANSLGSDFDSSAPFAELGIDSFRVLKIIKNLEAEFGTLPKTLLFENFNVGDLARWFVARHGQTLSTKFAKQLERPRAATVTATSSTQGAAPTPQARPVTRDEKPVGATDIAIVGMAGRYPKASNVNELWENLRQGRDCIENIPAERLARRVRNELTREYRGGFLQDVDRFDSLFFNISPREAEALDPQDRLFLEVAWEAIEDAGYYPETLVREGAPRNIGVFVGAVWTMYQILGVEQKLGGNNVNPNSFLWSIANRVSYWMNLTGPSLTLDTACSSSLTAVYLACESIQRGECSAAIVGGVNLDLHQHKFDINTAGGALSIDGVCRSFGAGANGYVAGEGIGALFLKPLQRAIEDRDNIHGVIKSVVVNHGGRTSGYTVPSPKAQADLIRAALDKAGVNAHSIGYIEAHGTGTELGDPVEVAGLTGAFESVDLPKGSCPIGSVKTNIGHLEAAAGVVSVCKVLLQMRHRQLVPSLHSSALNPHIDFGSSPFYVQQRLEEWHRRNVQGAEVPLRAGISSFGAGGANAHMVIEEYRRPTAVVAQSASGEIFPLSAKNEEQLREMGLRLRSQLEAQLAADPQGSQPGLSDIAFTLQRGRKSFDCRVAIIASSHDALIEKLSTFLAGGADTNILVGQASKSERITKLLSRTERDKFIGLLAQSRDTRKLAQLWVDGHVSDWRKLVPEGGGQRTSLPTYPFADRRHWVGSDQAKAATLHARASMHPLIDSNESTFQRQLFKKTLRPREFLLSEHVLADVPTLPGTAYLDLARKAGEIAAGGRRVHKIKNVVWTSPLTVPGASLDVFVELQPAGDLVQFEVFSENEAGTRQRYCQGKLSYASSSQGSEAVEHIDLKSIRARCAKAVDGKDAYPLFKSLGLAYGPSFQMLQEVSKSEAETLGMLKVPESRDADFDEFVLHPCVLDASMQAGVVAQLGSPSGEMKVPYSIGEVEILHPLTRTCYSHVTKVLDEKASGSRLSKENVVIVDEDGKVLVRIRESVGVPLMNVHAKTTQSSVTGGENFTKLYYSQAWGKAALANAPHDVASVLLFDVDARLRDACAEAAKSAGSQKPSIVLVLPGSNYEALADDTYRINPQEPGDYARLLQALSLKQWTVQNICYAWGSSPAPHGVEELDRALSLGAYSLLSLCQALIEHKGAGAVQMLYLYFATAQEPQPHNEAINGFLRTLCLEHPKISGKVVEIRQQSNNLAQVSAWILAELSSNAQDATTVRYQDGGRYTRRMEKLVPDSQPQEPWLKQRGAYVITGGAGGLGLIFARFLAERCQARLLLTGRSNLSAERQTELDQLKQLGAEVFYLAADVAKRGDAERVVHECKARFGRINGIVHSAGVLRDSYLRKKTRQEMADVIAPKVYGALYLDELTQNDDLDFFVLFSSLAAIGGNPGQADYAFANHYMDSFAARRESQVQRGSRSGRTLSFNWSLWADGGMKLDPQTELFFKQSLGIKPLPKTTGLEAFLAGLRTDKPQLAVLEGVHTKIEAAWGVSKKAAPAAPIASATKGGARLSSAVGKELSQLVMEQLKLDAGDLSTDSILLDLGFDSIGLSTFANAINAKYRLDINPVLFFEHTSIGSIAEHLAVEHADAVRAVHSGAPLRLVEKSTQRESDVGPAISFEKSRQFDAVVQSAAGQGAGSFLREQRFVREPIAIVGIAGLMPQSDGLDEYWDNLKHGRDLVTEIPRDRWIWEDHHGNPLKDVNKSNSRWGGFMKEIDKFDPLFFGIAAREAEMMDPQQRIFLQTVYHAIEDAGHKVSDLSGTKTGLFVGVSSNDYTNVLAEHQMGLDGYSAAGNSHSILANRVSFLLNLRGPSAPIDTACSSSLIALHRAIESIHTGSSDMAIVGGVQVMLTPIGHISLSSAGMLSVDGRCKTFDKDANGYVRGEGAGAILIKPLAKAQADGNPIYAVIRATAENHGGRATLLTAPNPTAQVELLMEAYEKAQVDPATVGYIECHGTGTGLGDSIEIQALKKSFGELYKRYSSTPAPAHCGLSSVKTNVGHLEPASGMASLLKVLLAIKHRQIPALLHLQELNPYINLKGSPFYIVDKLRAWEAPKDESGNALPRRAGISAFGWGGANAHVVIEEYVPAQQTAAGASTQPQLIVLSAKSSERLKAYAAALLAHVQKHSVELADLAYTLQVGRDAWEERLGFIVSSPHELQEKLRAYLAGDSAIEGMYRGRASRSRRGEDIAGPNAERMLEAWVKGVDVDWRSLDTSSSRKRISLPGYPFARERYWIDTTSKQQRGVPLAV